MSLSKITFLHFIDFSSHNIVALECFILFDWLITSDIHVVVMTHHSPLLTHKIFDVLTISKSFTGEFFIIEIQSDIKITMQLNISVHTVVHYTYDFLKF